MTSLQKTIKQIPANAGYYINVGDVRTTYYQQNGTDAAPLISSNLYAQSTVKFGPTATNICTLMAAGGSVIFRDMGKTLVSSTRVFRKVQLLTSTNSLVNGGTAGVGGIDSPFTNYLTGYIELPGTGGNSTGAAPTTAVARLG
jgi:hypothetical protein